MDFWSIVRASQGVFKGQTSTVALRRRWHFVVCSPLYQNILILLLLVKYSRSLTDDETKSFVTDSDCSVVLNRNILYFSCSAYIQVEKSFLYLKIVPLSF